MKDKHLCLRLYELNRKLSYKLIRDAYNHLRLANNWQVNCDFWYYNKEIPLDDLLKVVREYNNSMDNIFMGNDFEEYKEVW